MLFRTEPPYFPNGVVASTDGAVYVLEVGFTLPSAWSGPRVRKISAGGTNRIIATARSQDAGSVKAAVAQEVGGSAEAFLSFFLVGDRIKYGATVLGVTLLSTVAILWRGENNGHETIIQNSSLARYSVSGRLCHHSVFSHGQD